jgi:hypothetical protein
MADGETLYPLEIVLQGIRASLQTKNANHREAWKKQVAESARKRQRETSGAQRRLAVALEMEPPVAYIRIDDDLSWRTT